MPRLTVEDYINAGLLELLVEAGLALRFLDEVLVMLSRLGGPF